MDNSLDVEFVAEEIEEIAKGAIEATLVNTTFNRKKLDDWINAVVAAVLTGLQNLSKPYKYIVSCVIMQKTGAPMNTAAAMWWDTSTDGFCRVPWENEHLHCIITVFGMAISPATSPELE